MFIHPHQVKEIMKFSFCNSLFECFKSFINISGFKGLKCNI